ncbi:MAG TPA: nitrilase-related carbon-nitrogen hydrolase, partial [Polyangiaceae bacterium]|nr:nitrilase-related carbon-nitrogen hydrolase [Polyangiaceae bacterium]
INVCYDLQFPESAAAASEAGAELLACPCNNLLRPTTAEEWKLRHNQIRSERAREARGWILSSDVTGEHEGRIALGPTALIDPEGTVVAQVPLMTTGLLVVEPHIERLAPAQVIGN